MRSRDASVVSVEHSLACVKVRLRWIVQFYSSYSSLGGNWRLRPNGIVIETSRQLALMLILVDHNSSATLRVCCPRRPPLILIDLVK